MRAFTIETAQIKPFMRRLLRDSDFDLYGVRSVELTLLMHISVSGLLVDDNEETQGKKYASWGALRPLVNDLIMRDKNVKPRLLKVVFSHPNPEEVHSNAAALFLNFVYEKDAITFTTAVAQKEFVLDKSLDATWDEKVRHFFAGMGIEVTDKIGDLPS